MVVDNAPLVSVVIPTTRRSGLLKRALLSVYAQTFTDYEIIVVLDGADVDTITLLETHSNPQLRYLVNSVPLGGSEARNTGVRNSNGTWIAFLDDDDEWLPNKLEAQVRHLEALNNSHDVIITSRLIFKNPCLQRIEPDKLYDGRQPVAEYLFCVEHLCDRRWMQTSTILASRLLCMRVPFTRGLKMHQDYDFLLRAAGIGRAQIVMLPEPLTIWHHDDPVTHVGGQRDWRFSLDWMDKSVSLFTPASRSAFFCGVVRPPLWEIGLAGRFLTDRLQYPRPRLVWVLVWIKWWAYKVVTTLKRASRSLSKAGRPSSS